MFSKGGYTERVLWVDLSREKVQVKPLERELAVNFIGGTGFIAKLHWELTGPKTDPLGPDNVLIFAPGPISGTLWPGSGRFNVGAKSPLTGVWGEANSGGHFGPSLKQAGYDMIVIRGRAKKPVYLNINDDYVELRDAKQLWGKKVADVDQELVELEGDEDLHVACIGPAGENLVRFASIMTDCYRACGRSGMGAVMGSKNLKAIAAVGSKGITPADPEKFMELYYFLYNKLKESWVAEKGLRLGTLFLVESMNEIGRLPTKNHQMGTFPNIDKIEGYLIRDKYMWNNRACYGCHMRCHGMHTVPSGKYKHVAEHPEYESVDAFGPRVWNDDVESILYFSSLCEEYGMDTISTGAVIAMSMELWEKGIITEEDTEGIDFTWGNKDTIEKMIHAIAKQEGFGKVLGLGTLRAAKKIGRGAERYAMQVKGMAIAAQDGRAQKSMAIAHATSVRGADHLRHCSFFDEAGYDDVIKERYGEKYLPEMADRLAVKHKGFLARETELLAVMIDTFNSCVGTGVFYPATLQYKDLAEIYTALTGLPQSGKGLKTIAERVVTLRRAYNIRLGLTRKDDTLPERFTKEPAPTGPNKGHVVDLKRMIDDYYTMWGWDLKTGLVPRKNYEKLGLKYVADELQKLGKLPAAGA